MNSLYQQLLKEKYYSLPPAVQRLHHVEDHREYHGSCTSLRGSNPFNKLIASLLGLPPSGKSLPLRVTFDVKESLEIWTRYFGKDRFVSMQWQKNGFLHERLRLVTLVFAVNADAEKLSLELYKVLFLGINIRPIFRPQVKAVETEKNGIFHLSINVTLPLTGLLIQYDGWLKEQ